MFYILQFRARLGVALGDCKKILITNSRLTSYRSITLHVTLPSFLGLRLLHCPPNYLRVPSYSTFQVFRSP